MRLSDMADFICRKINQVQTEDVTACKSFLTRRHEMIWHESLWKDSLLQFTQTLSPTGYTTDSTWLPAKGVLLCPTIIDRVLAVRNDDRKMGVQRMEYYYRIDYDSFAKQGKPSEFVLLPAAVWEWETPQDIIAYRAQADNDKILSADLLDSDGIGVSRTSLTLNGTYTQLGTSERIDSVTGLARAQTVYLGAPGQCTVTNNVTMGLSTFDFYFVSEVPVGGSMSGYTKSGTLASGESAVMIPNSYIVYTPEDDPGILASSAVPGGSLFMGGIALGVEFTFTYDEPSGGVVLLPAATSAPRRQRIRLVEIPTEEVTLRILGKRICPQFDSDNDEPAINGVTNCLLAFGQSDMLQRERQYGKAQVVQQEAGALLDQLRKLEVVQQAHNISIQPSDGYVSEYQFNSGSYSPLTF